MDETKTVKRYPYYLCFSKEWDSYCKSIDRDQLEGEFIGLSAQLQPTQNLFIIASKMFRDGREQMAATN